MRSGVAEEKGRGRAEGVVDRGKGEGCKRAAELIFLYFFLGCRIKKKSGIGKTS